MTRPSRSRPRAWRRRSSSNGPEPATTRTASGLGWASALERGIDAVVHDRELLGRDAELAPRLRAGEGAADDHALGGAHHPSLDHGIEPVRVEVVVMGDDGNVETVAPPGDERGRPHVAK